MSTTQQAWLTKTDGPFEIKEAPVAAPDAEEVNIRLKAIAFQPIEAIQYVHGPIMGQQYPYMVGIEASGTF